MTKKFAFPHVFVLLTLIIFIASILTYIIPSGNYQREAKKLDNVTRNIVMPGTYKEIEKHISTEGILIGESVEGKASPVSVVGFFSSIPRGMEAAADIIFLIFIIGGMFGILQKSGVISASIQKLFDIFGKSSNFLIIILMLVVAIGGSTLGMGEEFIPLVPLFLIVSKKLGYDRIFGVAIVWIAAGVGFASATTNPFTVNIAQSIAEVKLYSGMEFRIIFLIVTLAVSIIYVLNYGKKILKDPSKSIMKDDEFEIEEENFNNKTEFKKEHGLIMIMGLVVFSFILYAVTVFGWWLNEMSGAFILIGVLTALICKMKINDAAKAFTHGASDMVVAALVVGFARGVQVVMQDGQILDSVIHYAANNLQNFHEFFGAAGMYVFQSSLNFFIPSGSGQAAVTMPLMAPLSDLLGITRQTAVFAFTCGDGFSNLIIPTSASLMAVLGIAKVPFVSWFKFALPLFLIHSLLTIIFLLIAVLVGY